ncbi:E3 ubiquitin-protein ligase RNF34-like [Ornithodoros turicata]|uniref:Putative e3 ubiquitin-protein ligase rnf34 n=1 Tax=Ornithodoros turicata TaxID=34597 RepID=A0A2R5LLE5_9ACAR
MSAATFLREVRELISLPGDGPMPCCDSCQTKFNLLRRKRTCTECRLPFCSGCLAREAAPLRCRRCTVGRAVPLQRQALQGLRVRDLRWMLHVRGITPHGVREKAELVDLILQHTQGAINGDRLRTPPSEVQDLGNGMPSSRLSNLSSSCPSLDRAENGKPDDIYLEELPDETAVEKLSVLQMKLILVRNFVDFRGCCEKRDLQDKVRWLWQQRCKARKMLQEQDLEMGNEQLCKICMEGDVDCVILECGHMCTCTTCGKQLSECPICRQYVVRVVHVFRV